MRPLPVSRADELAAELELDLDCGVCLACLSFVSVALDRGDPVEISRELRQMTPDLWEEGLADPALAAVRRARDRGVPDAEAALAERSGRSAVARAIVKRLAGQLVHRARARMRARLN